MVVPRRVAPVEADRVTAAPRTDLAEAAGDQIERLVPGDLLEVACRVATHRPAQPVRVVVDVGNGDALRADVALGEDVVVVAAHGDDAIVLDLELEPAGRLAERAGVKDGVRHASLRWNHARPKRNAPSFLEIRPADGVAKCVPKTRTSESA